jgi:serine/threonine protein kinase
LISKHADRHDPVYERFCFRVFQQAALAIHFLHYGVDVIPDWKPIIHRDITPENIWLKQEGLDHAPRVKLAGFSCARWQDSGPPHPRREAHQAGNPDFSPPEYPDTNKSSDGK